MPLTRVIFDKAIPVSASSVCPFNAQETYIERLREEPADVQLISAADKLHNARAILADYREIGPQVWKRFNAVGENRSGISMNSWQCTNRVEGIGSWTSWNALSTNSGRYRQQKRC
jgi:hypothetical protein